MCDVRVCVCVCVCVCVYVFVYVCGCVGGWITWGHKETLMFKLASDVPRHFYAGAVSSTPAALSCSEMS